MAAKGIQSVNDCRMEDYRPEIVEPLIVDEDAGSESTAARNIDSFFERLRGYRDYMNNPKKENR